MSMSVHSATAAWAIGRLNEVCAERDRLLRVARAARSWNDHYQRGKVPAGSRENLEGWYAEEAPLADALDAAVAALEEDGGGE